MDVSVDILFAEEMSSVLYAVSIYTKCFRAFVGLDSGPDFARKAQNIPQNPLFISVGGPPFVPVVHFKKIVVRQNCQILHYTDREVLSHVQTACKMMCTLCTTFHVACKSSE